MKKSSFFILHLSITLFTLLGWVPQGYSNTPMNAPIQLSPPDEKPGEEPYYPPATEPYQPLPPIPQAPPLSRQPLSPEPALEQPLPLGQAIPGNKIAPSPPLPSPYASVTREVLERAASQCKAEVEQLWQIKGQVPRHKLPSFQRSIGEAKSQCDALCKIVETFKQAEEHMHSFQKSLQQAQSVSK